MASGSKRGRRSTSARGKKAKKNQNPGITEEILLFVILGVSILLLLGTCGLLGSFGKIVRSVMVGIFGMVGFIVPFGFFFACTFWISNKWEKVTKVKLVTTFV